MGKIVYHVDNDGHGNPYDATLSFGDGGFQLADQPQHVTFTPCYFDAQGFTLSFYDTDNQLIMEKKSEKSIASVGGIISFATLEVKDPYNGHAYVDLGLPSGLKWATCNVGATAPEDYGDYFAWGETAPHQNNDYSSGDYTYFDNPATLPLDHDAARVKWGGNWRMPTKEEFEELKENCDKLWTTEGGVSGYKFTSKTNSDNYIFLPAAGFRRDLSLINDGVFGGYWSSSLEDNASSLNFNSSKVIWGNVERYCGLSVRPVCK